MRWLLLVLVGCAASVPNTCPVGTKIVTTQSDTGRTQGCTSTVKPLASLPVGRTFDQASGMLSTPAAMPGGLAGPFTSWHANGQLASHGTYVDEGGSSWPEGLWAFWYPNGQRRSLGLYQRGHAQGCFALWDEQGERVTGRPDGDQFRVAPCAPPDDGDIQIVEGRARGDAGDVSGDATIRAFLAPSTIGARNAMQVDPDPRLSVGFALTPRRRFGPVRVGPTVGLRLSDNQSYRGYTVGAEMGVVRAVHPRIDVEAAIDLSLQYTTVQAIRRDQLGTADLSFTNALPGANVAVSFALSPFIQAIAAVRLDGLPSRDVERSVRYCRSMSPTVLCSPAQQETWTLDGFHVGATLGLRLVLR